jgi:hypothetical protein
MPSERVRRRIPTGPRSTFSYWREFKRRDAAQLGLSRRQRPCPDRSACNAPLARSRYGGPLPYDFGPARSITRRCQRKVLEKFHTRIELAAMAAFISQVVLHPSTGRATTRPSPLGAHRMTSAINRFYQSFITRQSISQRGRLALEVTLSTVEVAHVLEKVTASPPEGKPTDRWMG